MRYRPIFADLLAPQIPKSEAKKVDHLPEIEIKCFAEIDGLEDKKPCVANPYQRWNGWAQPQFEKEVLLQILEESYYEVLEDKGDEVIVKMQDDEDWSIYKNNNGLFEVDGWCWDLVDSEGHRILSDGSIEV